VPVISDFGPAIDDFAGPFSNAHTEKIKAFLGENPNVAFLEAYVHEFRLLLFHRVKFYPDFCIRGDGSEWRAIRFAYDGIDYYLLIHKNAIAGACHVLLYYDNSDPSEEVTDKTFDKVSQATFAVFEMARKDFVHTS
jgi:hypothetical protein